jgi:hypothetical protein
VIHLACPPIAQYIADGLRLLKFPAEGTIGALSYLPLYGDRMAAAAREENPVLVAFSNEGHSRMRSGRRRDRRGGGDLIEIGRLRLRDRPLSQGDRAHRFANEGYVNFRRKLDQLGIRYSLIDLADPRYSSARPAARCRKPCSPNPFLLKLGRNPDHVTQVQNTFSGMDTGRFADVLARRIARDGATGMSSARLFLSLLFSRGWKGRASSASEAELVG